MKKNFFISLWLLTFIAMLLVFLMARKGFPDSLDLQTKLNPIENVLIGNQTQLTTSDLLANPNKSSQDITSLEEPFSLVLPKPDEAPVSLWRPPLYPTPWAISPHDHFYFSRPIAADEINWPLANYRYGYFFPDSDIIHTGIDITAKRGTPVIAAAPGTVIDPGTYTLVVSVPSEDEEAAYELTYEFPQAAVYYIPLTVGGSAAGYSESYERTYFELTVTEAVVVDIYSSGDYDLVGYISATKGGFDYFDSDDDSGSNNNFLMENVSLEPGVYYIDVDLNNEDLAIRPYITTSPSSGSPE